MYTWDTQQEQWDPTRDEDRRFMYHGRQRILTLSGSGADDELFKFVWGPDPGSGRALYRPNDPGVSLMRLLVGAAD